jgi:hypothetical protein
MPNGSVRVVAQRQEIARHPDLVTPPVVGHRLGCGDEASGRCQRVLGEHRTVGVERDDGSAARASTAFAGTAVARDQELAIRPEGELVQSDPGGFEAVDFARGRFDVAGRGKVGGEVDPTVGMGEHVPHPRAVAWLGDVQRWEQLFAGEIEAADECRTRVLEVGSGPLATRPVRGPEGALPEVENFIVGVAEPGAIALVGAGCLGRVDRRRSQLDHPPDARRQRRGRQ